MMCILLERLSKDHIMVEWFVQHNWINLSQHVSFENITKLVDEEPTVGIIYLDSERFQRNSP